MLSLSIETMSSIPSTFDAQFAIDKINTKMNQLAKKLEVINHQITVEENAFELRKEPVEKDKGYNYYVKERDNALAAVELSSREIDDKISTLEAKRDAEIKAINTEYDRKIDALERKKDLEKARQQSKADDRQRDIENVIRKFDSAKPTSVIYSKLLSNKEQTQKELEEVQAEWQNAIVDLQHASQKASNKRIADALRIQQRLDREQAIRDAEELKRIEQGHENRRKEELEKAKQRSRDATVIVDTPEPGSTLKFAVTMPPKGSRAPKSMEKKLSFPLDPKKKYTIEQLRTLSPDYDVDAPEDCEMWDRLYSEAAKREELPSSRYECKVDENAV